MLLISIYILIKFFCLNKVLLVSQLFSPFTSGVVVRQAGREIGTLLIQDKSVTGTSYCRLDEGEVVSRWEGVCQ